MATPKGVVCGQKLDTRLKFIDAYTLEKEVLKIDKTTLFLNLLIYTAVNRFAQVRHPQGLKVSHIPQALFINCPIAKAL